MLQCVVSVVYCIKSNNLPSLNCLASPLRWEQGWRYASGPGSPTGTRGACRVWSRAGPRRGAQQRPKKGGRQVSHPKRAKFLMRRGRFFLLGICKEWPMLSYTTDDALIAPSVVVTRNTSTPGFLVCIFKALPFLTKWLQSSSSYNWNLGYFWIVFDVSCVCVKRFTAKVNFPTLSSADKF